MTDNAFAYAKNRSLRELLAVEGIKHLLTQPYRPQTNGKVERFHQTMAREWAYGMSYRSHRHRNEALPHWLRHYNETRPHSSLGGRPPISRVHNVRGQDSELAAYRLRRQTHELSPTSWRMAICDADHTLQAIDLVALRESIVAEDAKQVNGVSEPPKQERAKPDPPGYFEGESMTRRRVFTVGAQALGGLAGAAIVLPAVGFAVAPIFHRGKERWEAVGPVSDFVEDTYRQVVFTETEGIGDAGKTTAYVRKSSKELGEEPGKFVAVSNRCAHLGCPVRFVEAAGNFICPCHGGVYDFQGKRIGGPPVRPLDQFQTRVRGGQVEVGPRYSVTNQMEPVRARDPGEFTGGIWEYLYPPRPSTFPPP